MARCLYPESHWRQWRYPAAAANATPPMISRHPQLYPQDAGRGPTNADDDIPPPPTLSPQRPQQYPDTANAIPPTPVGGLTDADDAMPPPPTLSTKRCKRYPDASFSLPPLAATTHQCCKKCCWRRGDLRYLGGRQKWHNNNNNLLTLGPLFVIHASTPLSFSLSWSSPFPISVFQQQRNSDWILYLWVGCVK